MTVRGECTHPTQAHGYPYLRGSFWCHGCDDWCSTHAPNERSADGWEQMFPTLARTAQPQPSGVDTEETPPNTNG